MSQKVSVCEVLVAGGGIIGAACARAAAQRGMKVLICEPGPDPAAASAASAGVPGPQIGSTDEAPAGPGFRGRDLSAGLPPPLAASTGIGNGVLRGGVAAPPCDESAARRPRGARADA